MTMNAEPPLEAFFTHFFVTEGFVWCPQRGGTQGIRDDGSCMGCKMHVSFPKHYCRHCW